MNAVSRHSYCLINTINMKACLILIIIIFITLSGCGPAYVVEEPAYIEIQRPPAPRATYIWVDGDWVYSRRAHGYVRREGYWVAPRQGRTFVPGHWEATPRGKYWKKGHWR